MCICVFFGLLAGLPLLAASIRNEWLALANSFYRSGALVFGGGHVVLPLLDAATVGRGLLTRDEFLADTEPRALLVRFLLLPPISVP